MNKLLMLLLLIISTTVLAQIRLKPDVIEKANALMEKYPDEGYIALNSIEKFTFRYVANDKKVHANHDLEEHIMSLKENENFRRSIFYNEESVVKDLRLKNYKSVKQYFPCDYEDYSPNGIFYQDAKICSLGFDLVTRGDNSTYSYTKEYKDVKYLTKAFFYKHYPVECQTLEFTIPDWLTVELVEMNFEGYTIEKQEAYNASKKIKTIKYTMKDLLPIKYGKRYTSNQNQLPHLLILSKSYSRHGKDNTLFSSTQDLYNWYASLTKELENKPEEFKAFVDDLIQGKETDVEKVEAIFYWVQDNIRYIAYEDGIMGFKPADAYHVYHKRFGDCKGMANLTSEMLKLAGFDARLTWIGTKALPYTYETPSLAVDNHMITTLMLDGEKYYLDATETGVAFKDYAYRIQGQQVLIADGDGYMLETVPEFDNIHNLQKSTVFLTIEDDVLKGNGVNVYHGEEKTNLYRSINSVSKSDLKDKIGKYIGKFDKNFNITNVEVSDYLNRNIPIEFKYDMELSNKITSVANEKYINLEMDFDYSKTKSEEYRNLDFDFHQKKYLERTVKLKIPEGYSIDYMPESINIDNEEFSFNMKYSFNESDREVEYSKSMIIKTGVVSVSNFKIWDETIKAIINFYNDQVVLVK